MKSIWLTSAKNSPTLVENSRHSRSFRQSLLNQPEIRFNLMASSKMQTWKPTPKSFGNLPQNESCLSLICSRQRKNSSMLRPEHSSPSTAVTSMKKATKPWQKFWTLVSLEKLSPLKRPSSKKSVLPSTTNHGCIFRTIACSTAGTSTAEDAPGTQKLFRASSSRFGRWFRFAISTSTIWF